MKTKAAMVPEKFRLTIELGNDAMQTRSDVASALEALARTIRADPRTVGPIHDVNGNRVGKWSLA